MIRQEDREQDNRTFWAGTNDGMFPVTNKKLVLIGFRPLYTTGGIRIRIGLLATALTLIRTIASFVLIPVDVSPDRSGIDACKRGQQEVFQLQSLSNKVEENGVKQFGTDLGSKVAQAAMNRRLVDV